MTIYAPKPQDKVIKWDSVNGNVSENIPDMHSIDKVFINDNGGAVVSDMHLRVNGVNVGSVNFTPNGAFLAVTSFDVLYGGGATTVEIRSNSWSGSENYTILVLIKDVGV